MRADPIGIKGGDVNLLVYVRNNPGNLIDNLGLEITQKYIVIPGHYSDPSQYEEKYEAISDALLAQKLANIARSGLSGGALAAALKALQQEVTPGTGDVMQIYARLLDYMHAKFSFGWVVYTRIDYEECEEKECFFSLLKKRVCQKKTTGWRQCKRNLLYLGHYAYQTYADALDDVPACMDDHLNSFIKSLNQ